MITSLSALSFEELEKLHYTCQRTPNALCKLDLFNRLPIYLAKMIV